VNDCVRVTMCRLCDSHDLDLIVAFAPTPPGDAYIVEPKHQPSYPLDLLSCRSCGAVQLADTVDPRLIYTDYIYTTSISPGLDRHFDAYAESVLDRLKPNPGAFVVDIGSNDGTLLKAFQRRGCQVLGVDPAKEIARIATASGVQTECGYFSHVAAYELSLLHGRADIITANHVMANVANLHDFTQGVKALLAPDGTFVFETGYWPSILQHRLIDTIEHEHIHYFAVAPLAQFFERHGLRLVSLERQPTKGGSLRGFVRHADGSAADASVERLIGQEQWFDAKYLRQWALGLDWLRGEIAQCVDLKPKTERWVGYGAAVGSTLLLHQFGIGNVLTELWDDNASRHGRFSPGLHLPVVPPNHSEADKIVILAWRYADAIMKAHPEHAGKWILPLPHLRFA
jgi:SAM-dependent methyltransferase